jgi:hypothetical protein
MKWQKTEVAAVIGEFDRAAYDAGSLLDKLGEITPTLTRRCSQLLRCVMHSMSILHSALQIAATCACRSRG